MFLSSNVSSSLRKVIVRAQNGLGIVAAGGLGGFLYLQKGEQARLEAEQDAQRAQQRAEVDGLSSQVQNYTSAAGLLDCLA